MVASRAQAEKLLPQAKSASPVEWGKLVVAQSLDKVSDAPVRPGAPSAPELTGDLGIVSPPGAQGDNARVPEPLRAAVFKIDTVGGVFPEVVEADGKFHIVRLTGKTEARKRNYDEAERQIRVAIIQQKIRQREEQLQQELRKRFPVKLNSEALAKVDVNKEAKPSAAGSAAP
jgi:hypothetical protein